MKLYIVMKQSQRVWGINPRHPHEVWPTRSEANKACSALNKAAQHYRYTVESIEACGSLRERDKK